jgi:hypothetical protein
MVGGSVNNLSTKSDQPQTSAGMGESSSLGFQPKQKNLGIG